jgi:predicted short-subunit dehydrogenase-like oxidoreductase (DUF2520 family)
MSFSTDLSTEYLEQHSLKDMKELTINFIGAGNLGKTIARLMHVNSIGKILGICNSTIASSLDAINFIGQGKAYACIQDLPTADLIFITVPDDQIKIVCDELSQSNNLHNSCTVVHCSGLLSSDVLLSVKAKGADIVSVHPMQSFANPELSSQQFTGTYCAVEGDCAAEKLVTRLFTQLGAHVIKIPKHKKAIYHASLVMASNYLVTLTSQAIKNLIAADISESEATTIVLDLMQNTLENLIEIRSPEKSLTGPIKRGDVQTIKLQMAEIKNDMAKKLYSTLGIATLELTSHDPKLMKLLKEALQD